MTDEQRKMLTEYLGECWHILHQVHPSEYGILTCVKCGENMAHSNNRTFTTDTDMMAVYRAIYRDGKWEEFTTYSNEVWWVIDAGSYAITEEEIANYTAYLFCLDGKGYEERCKMVSEFYGWEEGE